MADQTIEKVIEHIDNNNSFILDAGAGSGKTYCLMQTIKYLQTNKKTGKILCITYTNVAKNEILHRLRNKKNIMVSTMHDFLWDYCKNFQNELIQEVENLITELIEKKKSEIIDAQRKIDSGNTRVNIQKQEEIIEKNTDFLLKYEDYSFNEVRYLSFCSLRKGIISHDELLKIAKVFLQKRTFVEMLMSSYQYVLIDEYQDTDKLILEPMLRQFKNYKADKEFIIGLYGDKMQHIYGKGVENVNDDFINEYGLHKIEKIDNYRSCSEIIDTNNIFRRDTLNQECRKNDLICESIEFVINKSSDIDLKEKLADNLDKFTRLYLSHRKIAEEGGFSNLSGLFSEEYHKNSSEMLLKLEDPIIDFVMSKVIPIFIDLASCNYSSVIQHMSIGDVTFNELKNIGTTVDELVQSATKLSDFIDVLKTLSAFDDEKYNLIEAYYIDRDKKAFIDSLMDINLSEYAKLYNQIYTDTGVNTFHGVKGEEYNHVVINVEEKQRWNKYNFDKLFKLDFSSKSVDKAHKLLYVACTRAINTLIINYQITDDSSINIDILKENILTLFGEKMSITELN